MAIGRSNSWRTICLVIMVSFVSMISLSYQADTIFLGQSIHANQTITSQGGVFELGFFSPGNSGKFYIGIWYKSIPSFTVAWVANRDIPIPFSDRDDANLILTTNGDLQLQVNGQVIWGTGTTPIDHNTTKAVLLDSGKLVVGPDGWPNMWESFDYPTDTWLPGAPLRNLASWTNLDDPGSGTYALDRYKSSSTELGLWSTEKHTRWRIRTSNDTYINFSDVYGDVSYTTLDNSTTIRMVLDHSGVLRLLIWNEKRARWLTLWAKPNDFCERPEACGGNGICTVNQDPACKCLRGFQPKSISEWESGDHSNGCIRSNRSKCLKDKDEFIALYNIKLPLNPAPLHVGDAEGTAEVSDICRSVCASDCQCLAYSVVTSECYQWTSELQDMIQLHSTVAGETIYLRVFSPKEGKIMLLLITLAPTICGLILVVLGSLSYYAYKKKIMKGAKGQDLLLFDLEMSNKRHTSQVQSGSDNKRGNRDLALPTFSLSSIFSATDNFSSSNKLGEGGFGPVYKGKLSNGQEVAVKRLSKHSGQGLKELINEAKLIAKLQHTNLVTLLGCCIQKDEKILIYEYMPNKSLDFFLFDRIKRETLDWSIRVCIIKGIAQGLLYLHHYSRLRIIHRDLKASNILLDADMKPKISDFGMAKIFGGNQLQANTKHIAGTFGYMPPEYALQGLFSVKSDVFSFGVLLLEIISGERNTSCRHEECLSLLGYAWKLWTNDRPLELIDPILRESCDLPMALRCVHVGLLCVQEYPDDRPNMLDVVAMIGNEKKVIETQPKQPAYLPRRSAPEVQPERFSLNGLTDSTMQPR